MKTEKSMNSMRSATNATVTLIPHPDYVFAKPAGRSIGTDVGFIRLNEQKRPFGLGPAGEVVLREVKKDGRCEQQYGHDQIRLIRRFWRYGWVGLRKPFIGSGIRWALTVLGAKALKLSS